MKIADSSFATQSPRIETERLLYGSDPLSHLVAVEPAGPNRMRLYRRSGDRLEVLEDVFQPWLLVAEADPWRALRSRPSIRELDGDHPLRFLVEFGSWAALLDASRGAEDTGITFVRLRSPVEQYLVQSGRTLFKGMVFEDIRRLQIDIETTGFDARQPDTQVIVAAIRTADGVEEVLALESSEADLLDRITERIQALDPDTIEGHNLFNFDLPFLATRAERHGRDLTWGRDGSPVRISQGTARFKVAALTLPYTPAYVYGRHVIDTYQQIQRYDVGGRLTSYGLKNAVEELGLTRTDREFVPGDQISKVWRADPDRILRYALDDVRDVDTLSKLATPTEFYQTQILPRSLQAVATGGPGEKINDLMLRAYLMSNHSVPKAERARGYPGAHAELLATGVFAPVVKCDVESLYPSIMLADSISPRGDSLGAYLPMLADLTRRRLEAKAMSRLTEKLDQQAEHARWEGLQSSFKVLINSFYGYLGYGGGFFNDYDAATRITLAGQDIVKQVVHRLQQSGATPIEVDTDGVYFVPPAAIADAESEEAYIERIAANLPTGIKLTHDGRYRAMLSLRLKTYALLSFDDGLLLKGSALRSRRMEPCFRVFLQDAARQFLNQDRDAAREAYFTLAERIRTRSLATAEFVQWGMLNEETLAKFPRMQRLIARTPRLSALRSGERIETYERQDGELGFIEEYDGDENMSYLLRRLHDVAERFDGLFSSNADFDAFFPALTARTDLEAARGQTAAEQLSLFAEER
ncbi:MAG: ribonuclease H-like domain-containing protein [Chloroflexota bacterium]|nr:ribonuclease H-like domain-containing protein [Chloroflexota bacterium]